MEQLISFLILIIPIAFLVYAYICMYNEVPLFKKRCCKCGCKDKNWKAVSIGHDSFAWQHHCDKETEHEDITRTI